MTEIPKYGKDEERTFNRFANAYQTMKHVEKNIAHDKVGEIVVIKGDNGKDTGEVINTDKKMLMGAADIFLDEMNVLKKYGEIETARTIIASIDAAETVLVDMAALEIASTTGGRNSDARKREEGA